MFPYCLPRGHDARRSQCVPLPQVQRLVNWANGPAGVHFDRRAMMRAISDPVFLDTCLTDHGGNQGGRHGQEVAEAGERSGRRGGGPGGRRAQDSNCAREPRNKKWPSPIKRLDQRLGISKYNRLAVPRGRLVSNELNLNGTGRSSVAQLFPDYRDQ